MFWLPASLPLNAVIKNRATHGYPGRPNDSQIHVNAAFEEPGLALDLKYYALPGAHSCLQSTCCDASLPPEGHVHNHSNNLQDVAVAADASAMS